MVYNHLLQVEPLASTLIQQFFKLNRAGNSHQQPIATSQHDTFTLWLCQNSYWKWPFIVDVPIENGDFP